MQKEDVKVETIVKTGTVSNCELLNVRTNPTLESDVVTEIWKGAKVELDLSASNEEWYKVKIDPKTCGYCLKKFINPEE